jgi:hypothetical protein
MASIEIDGVNGVIKSTVSDADLTIKGNDGGSETTAVTFDMSDAGTAVFNHDIKLANDQKAIFGTASNLEIYADSINSYIKETGSSGNLQIIGNTVRLQSASDEIMLEATNDAGVDIRHNHVTKLLTTASGIDVTGSVTANGGLIADNITIDGTEIDLSSGDLTLDVASDIILDADGGNVKFRDAGSGVGRLANDSSDFVIQVDNSDNDIKFKGEDGGSAITALTLDMSDSGNAIFNNKLNVGNSVTTRGSVSPRLAPLDNAVYAASMGMMSEDDRDPKPGDFPTGQYSGFATYDGTASSTPYADVMILDTFGHSSGGNANAIFISKADPNDIKIAQQTTQSSNTFASGTQTNIDTTSISDASVKENVQDITGALDKIAQLRPVTFEWTDEYINNGLSKNASEKTFTGGELATFYTDDDELPEGKKVGDVKTEGSAPTRVIPDTKVTNVGLIAQEVEAVIPTVVHQNRVSLSGSEDYQKNIDYDKLVPHLIGAIKELKDKIEALEG